MTYHAVGLPELVEMLRLPMIRDRRVTTAGELATLLEDAGRAKWQQPRLTAGQTKHDEAKPAKEGDASPGG